MFRASNLIGHLLDASWGCRDRNRARVKIDLVVAEIRAIREFTRDFAAIPNHKFQEALCAVARALAAVEPEAENGARPARASRSRPMPATKAG